MRGPEFKQGAKKRAGVARGAKKAGGVARRAPARPAKARIMGGKVVARALYFQKQREYGDVDGKAMPLPDTPTRSLTVQTRSTQPARSSRAKRKAEQAYPLLDSFKHKRSLEAAAPAQPVQQAWRPLGPLSIPHGQTYGRGRGSRPSVSGRISSIAVDPNNPDHILIGTGGGGVWESTDTGRKWVARTDDQPSLSIGAVAFNPSDPSIVYAGTGEGDNTFVNTPNLLGAGLLRSNDGGATWSVHATSVFNKVGFYDIAVDPQNGNHLLAATTVGIFEIDQRRHILESKAQPENLGSFDEAAD